MARVFKRSHSFTCTPTRSAFAFPATVQLVLIYRPRRDVTLRQFTSPKVVTHIPLLTGLNVEHLQCDTATLNRHPKRETPPSPAPPPKAGNQARSYKQPRCSLAWPLRLFSTEEVLLNALHLVRDSASSFQVLSRFWRGFRHVDRRKVPYVVELLSLVLCRSFYLDEWRNWRGRRFIMDIGRA